MSKNPSLFFKNALTATSLAAFRVPGALFPCSKAYMQALNTYIYCYQADETLGTVLWSGQAALTPELISSWVRKRVGYSASHVWKPKLRENASIVKINK